MACHNLLRLNHIPRGTNMLLGLGLNYCIKHDTFTKTTEHTFTRLRLSDDIMFQWMKKNNHHTVAANSGDLQPPRYNRGANRARQQRQRQQQQNEYA